MSTFFPFLIIYEGSDMWIVHNFSGIYVKDTEFCDLKVCRIFLSYKLLYFLPFFFFFLC